MMEDANSLIRPKAGTLEMPGLRLRYDSWGAGPLLILCGTSSRTSYDALAQELARHFTVIIYDLRGLGESSGEDTRAYVMAQADDLASLIDHLGCGPAHVFANSGGATYALDLLTRSPDRALTVIAHEPPLLELMPDRAALRDGIDAVLAAYRSDGLEAAWPAFVDLTGFSDEDADQEAEPAYPSLTDRPAPAANDDDFFFSEMLLPTTRYAPDIEALRRQQDKIVIAAGRTTSRQLCHRCSDRLAKLLDKQPVLIAGNHIGFVDHPIGFAAAIREILNDTR